MVAYFHLLQILIYETNFNFIIEALYQQLYLKIKSGFIFQIYLFSHKFTEKHFYRHFIHRFV